MAPKAAKKPATFVASGITAVGRSKTYKRRGGGAGHWPAIGASSALPPASSSTAAWAQASRRPWQAHAPRSSPRTRHARTAARPMHGSQAPLHARMEPCRPHHAAPQACSP